MTKYQVNVCEDGTISLSHNGLLHRESDPAVIMTHNLCIWWINGQQYKLIGPSCDYGNRCEWWLNGKRHRVDGPAILCGNGYEEWWLNGKRHCLTGPAIYNPTNEYRDWWIDGNMMTEHEHKHHTTQTKELTVSQIEKLLGFPVKIVK